MYRNVCELQENGITRGRAEEWGTLLERLGTRAGLAAAGQTGIQGQIVSRSQPLGGLVPPACCLVPRMRKKLSATRGKSLGGGGGGGTDDDKTWNPSCLWELLSSKRKDWPAVSSFSRFVFLPLKTALYISLPQPSLTPEKSGLIHFGKIFNNKGFLNNFQFHQEVIHPECPSPQESQLVKVLLKHVSTEKCRRQLSMPNKTRKKVSRLRKSSSGCLFSCQPCQACHQGCRGAHRLDTRNTVESYSSKQKEDLFSGVQGTCAQLQNIPDLEITH